jgi:transposase
LEYGIIVPQGISKLRKEVPEILGTENELTETIRSIVHQLLEDLHHLDIKVKSLDKQLQRIMQQNPVCQEMVKMKGVGPILSTALISAVGDGKEFTNGRHMAAWLGLVPRQNSSGNKQLLLGISKHGDRYIRKLLIHGARAYISRGKHLSDWLQQLIMRVGKQKAYVALANKMARILWVIIRYGVNYKPAF